MFVSVRPTRPLPNSPGRSGPIGCCTSRHARSNLAVDTVNSSHEMAKRFKPSLRRNHDRVFATAAAGSTSDDGERTAAANAAPAGPMPAPLVVVEGDIVTFHMTCRDADGNVIESTKDTSKDNEPMAFEVGAGEIVGNALFQAFDGALRGLGVGEAVELQLDGGEWQRDLLFTVPRDHPEVQRLEGRYKNVGGLREGLAVELANSRMAVVVEANDDHVQLDANSMMAGKQLLFQLEVLDIQRG